MSNVYKLPSPWTFTLVAGDGGIPLQELGKGTLAEGDALVRELDRQFGEYEGHYTLAHFFKLPHPYDKIPVYLYEGGDIMATRGEEIFYDGTYYNKEEDRYEIDSNGGIVIEGRWVK
mgnify:FL=1|jgi:hypothetical protein|tara:strand:+ start:386 stop:736 length:351 start_codon:yes stop_codon:yes gene_type:complete